MRFIPRPGVTRWMALRRVEAGSLLAPRSGTACALLLSRSERFFRQCFEMTRHPLIVSGQPKLRLLGAAAIEHVWTAGVEPASAGWVDRARHVALQDDRV